MASTDEQVQKRLDKRPKMRQSLDSSFSDPLRDFHTPTAVRKISKSIDDESVELEGRLRKIFSSSDEPIGKTSDKVHQYLDQRQELVEHLQVHLQKVRKIIREASTELSSGLSEKELKRAFTEIVEVGRTVQKERSAIAADQTRVKYLVLSQASHVKLGEAYITAITENLPEAAVSAYKKQHGRSKADQISFRNRLIKAYNKKGDKILETPPEYPNVQDLVSYVRDRLRGIDYEGSPHTSLLDWRGKTLHTYLDSIRAKGMGQSGQKETVS